jgi:CxxC motif-containing protein
MTRTFTCIVCPLGCTLTLDGDPEQDLAVTGNRCPRGAAYAQEEARAPKRVVTATCGIAAPFPSAVSRRVPVKSTAPCPKEKINDLLRDIYALKVRLPIKAGEKVITGWQGTGIDVIAARSLG